MSPILSFENLTDHLRHTGRRFKLAIVCGSDESTLQAVEKSVSEGFAEAYFVGHCDTIKAYMQSFSAPDFLHYIDAESAECAAQKAVMMVHEMKADVLVKGLIPTHTLLHAVLNKEWGILPKGRVLTHIAMCEVPSYDKLIFFSDAAVIPYPTQAQRLCQVCYMAQMLHAFGLEEPRVALIHCSENADEKFPHTLGYADICHRAKKGEWGKLIVDGPLDLRTSCDNVALKLKGIHSSIEGKADGLIFPDIESANAIYKALPLFAGARVAGTLQGTISPVVLPSRGDNVDAKFHSIALAIMSCQ